MLFSFYFCIYSICEKTECSMVHYQKTNVRNIFKNRKGPYNYSTSCTPVHWSKRSWESISDSNDAWRSLNRLNWPFSKYRAVKAFPITYSQAWRRFRFKKSFCKYFVENLSLALWFLTCFIIIPWGYWKQSFRAGAFY